MARISCEPRARQTVVVAEGGVSAAIRYRTDWRLRGHAHPSDWVLVHDAARPCLIDADLDRLLDQLADDPVGGLLPRRCATPRNRRMNRTGRDDRDRSRLWHALTPQMFRLELLHESLRGNSAQRLTGDGRGGGAGRAVSPD